MLLIFVRYSGTVFYFSVFLSAIAVQFFERP